MVVFYWMVPFLVRRPRKNKDCVGLLTEHMISPKESGFWSPAVKTRARR